MPAAQTIPRPPPPREPGPLLYAAVRGALIAQDDSLNQWCMRNAVSRQWAYRVLTGKARGPAARHLVDQLIQAAGLYQ